MFLTHKEVPDWTVSTLYVGWREMLLYQYNKILLFIVAQTDHVAVSFVLILVVLIPEAKLEEGVKSDYTSEQFRWITPS